MERVPFGQKGEEQLDADGISDHSSLVCTHMATSDDDDQLMASSAHAQAHIDTHDSAREARDLKGFFIGRVRRGVGAKFSPRLHEGPCPNRRVRDWRAGGVWGAPSLGIVCQHQ